MAPPPKASKRQTPQQAAINGSDLFGSTPFSVPSQQPAPISHPQSQPFAVPNRPTPNGPTPNGPYPNGPYPNGLNPNGPNYDISDFNLQTSVFNTTSFTNGLSGFDPFDTQKSGNIFGNGFNPTFNGFGNLSEKPVVELDSNFNGFLDKTISEMKVRIL